MMPIMNIIMDRVQSVNPADGQIDSRQIPSITIQWNGQRLYTESLSDEKADDVGPVPV